jgi:hypothetical protein
LTAILQYFVALKNLHFKAGVASDTQIKLDRHKGFFVRRRAEDLGRQNPAWVVESGQTTLKARIQSEFEAVDELVKKRAGTVAVPGSLCGGVDPRDPPHLDLVDVGKIKTATPDKSAKQTAKGYLELRRYRIQAIIWRAAAIHNELWSPAADGLSATLKAKAVDEVLDRRLRAVERMNFQISVRGSEGLGDDAWGANIAPNTAAPFEPVTTGANPQEWRWGYGNRRIERNVPFPPGIFFPPAVAPHFV